LWLQFWIVKGHQLLKADKQQQQRKSSSKRSMLWCLDCIQAAEQLDFKITEIGRQANAKWQSHKFEAAMQPSQLVGSGGMPPHRPHWKFS
jgi:hypothetical protein